MCRETVHASRNSNGKRKINCNPIPSPSPCFLTPLDSLIVCLKQEKDVFFQLTRQFQLYVASYVMNAEHHILHTKFHVQSEYPNSVIHIQTTRKYQIGRVCQSTFSYSMLTSLRASN